MKRHGRGAFTRTADAHWRKAVRALAACLALASVSAAQEWDDDTLDEIVVTATRTEHALSETPGSVSVVDRGRLDEKGGTDVAAAIDEVDGVEVLSHGGAGAASSAHIRGTYGVHTLVMVDGRAQNSPAMGLADLSGVSPAFVDRIEIVRGPASALYGAGGVGGLIHVLTRDPPAVPTWELDTFRGNFETMSVSLLAGVPFGTGGAVLGAHDFLTSGHRPNSAAGSTEFFGKIKAGEVDSGLFVLTLGRKDSSVGWPGAKPAPDPADRDATQLAFGNDEVSSLFDHGGAARSYAQADFRRGGFRARASFDQLEEDVHQEWIQSVYVGPGPFDYAPHHFVQDKTLDTVKPSVDVDARWAPQEGLRFLAGASFGYDRLRVESSDVDIDIPAATPSGRIDERTTSAVWMQAEFEDGPWQTVAGLRYDDPSDYDGKASGRAVWALRSDSGLRFEVGVGTAFRAPSLDDLNWPADFWSAGNPDLKPENAFESDLSLKWRGAEPEGPSASATVFAKNVEDMIVWAPDSESIWTPTNLNDVNIRGAELSFDAPLGRGLRLRAGYAFMDSHEEGPKVTEVDWNPIPEAYAYTEIERDTAYTPDHQVDLALEWSARIGPGTLAASVSAGWRSEVLQYYETWTPVAGNMTDVTYPTKTLDARWLMGARVGWSAGRGEVFVRVDNLLDTEYATQFGPDIDDLDYPMPGRSVTVGAKATF